MRRTLLPTIAIVAVLCGCVATDQSLGRPQPDGRSARAAAPEPVPMRSLPEIKKSGYILVGATGDYAPLTWQVGTSWTGFDATMARSLANTLGVELRFVQTTWPTLSADLAANRFDIAVGGVSRTPARAAQFDLSNTVFVDGKVPLVLCRNVDRFANLGQINQPSTHIVENAGGTNESTARELAPLAKLTVVPLNSQPVPMVLNGSADLFITDNIEAKYYMSHNRSLCVSTKKMLTSVDKVYLEAKGNTTFMVATNTWLGYQQQSGELTNALRSAEAADYPPRPS